MYDTNLRGAKEIFLNIILTKNVLKTYRIRNALMYFHEHFYLSHVSKTLGCQKIGRYKHFIFWKIFSGIIIVLCLF